MSRRGGLVVLALALVACGAIAFVVWRAPPLDLVPVASRFLTELDEGHELEVLQSGLLRDRWDLMGLLESNAHRQRRLGRFLRVESASEAGEVEFPPGLAHGVGRRMRLRVVFERGANDMTFTFARRGTTWMVGDFAFAPTEPAERPGLEQHMRRIALQLAEDVGGNRWPRVHDRLLRADRIAHPQEEWAPQQARHIEGAGLPQPVEERGWTFAAGRGTLAARLVFEKTHRDLDLELAYDPSEGRVVITRFAFVP